MSTTQTTPFMKMVLPKPGPGGELGPTWAQDLFDALMDRVDAHDHGADNGQKVTPAGMDITADLSFLGSEGANHNATDLRSARLAALAGAIGSDPSDRRALFVVGNDLYFIDGNGNVIQITLAGAINVAGVGGISGMAGGAAVAYVPLTKTFVFIQAANTPGNIDAGEVTVREAVLNGNGINLKAPNALAASFDWVFPGALPGAKSILTIDGAGQVGTQLLDTTLMQAGQMLGYARATNNAPGVGANRFVAATAITQAQSNIVTSVAYPAKKVGNKLRVRAGIASAGVALAGGDYVAASLFQDAGNAVAVALQTLPNNGSNCAPVVEAEIVAADLAAHTYKVGLSSFGGNVNWNGGGGALVSWIEVTEIQQ